MAGLVESRRLLSRNRRGKASIAPSAGLRCCPARSTKELPNEETPLRARTLVVQCRVQVIGLQPQAIGTQPVVTRSCTPSMRSSSLTPHAQCPHDSPRRRRDVTEHDTHSRRPRRRNHPDQPPSLVRRAYPTTADHLGLVRRIAPPATRRSPHVDALVEEIVSLTSSTGHRRDRNRQPQLARGRPHIGLRDVRVRGARDRGSDRTTLLPQ